MLRAGAQERPGINVGSKPDMLTKSGLEGLLKEELSHNGYNYVQQIENNLLTKGRGVFKASGKDKPTVAIRVYKLGPDVNVQDVCDEVLHQSSLHHPHIVQPKSLIRTPHFLCIAMEHANGGDVFRLARRAGASGLPLPAARFIFQQLVLTLDYAHHFSIYVCRINPSNVLVFWNDRGMPILKIADFRLARPQVTASSGSTPVIGTMYACPHHIRQSDGGTCKDAALAQASDAWAACVTFYFLLFARWPFDKQQIAAWAATPRAEWKDDAFIDYPEKDGLKDIVSLFRTVFACGRMTRQDFAAKCPSIADIQELAWFKVDLPDGAADMKAAYIAKTNDRKESPAFAKLREILQNAVSPEVTHLSAKMEATTLRDPARRV